MNKETPIADGVDNRLEWSLLLLRLGVFIVMFVWTIEKFVNPGHAINIMRGFYGIDGVAETLVYGMAVAELVLLLLFISGIKRRWTYGIVALLHTGSTFSSFAQYLDPFNNMLFFAAWPMWAACVALYLLRDRDNKLTAPRHLA